MRKTRQRTRATLPSSIGAARPKAMLLIAPAVDRPMPGSFISSSGDSGNRPPKSDEMIFAARWRLRARA